jgi:sulfur transfer protein SufE
LSYREYIGDYGNEIKNELLQMFPDVTYMCMTFDTVSVIKEAIIYLLSTGDDYEDYNKLMNAIRKNKIVGCLGNVYFDVDGNTRASSQYLIQQIYYNSTSKALSLFVI